MPVTIDFLMESQYNVGGWNLLNKDQQSLLSFNGDWDYTDLDDEIDLRSREYLNNSETAQRIIEGFARGGREGVQMITSAVQDVDNVLSNFFAIISLRGVSAREIGALGVNSRSGKRVQDPVTKTWIAPKTLPMRYKINNLLYRLPYSNYDNNDTGDVNCVLGYFDKNYPRLSKNKMKKAFADGCDIETLINYVNDNNIKTKLVNVDGDNLFINHDKIISKQKCCYAMVADNHFYPLNPNHSNTFPKLLTNRCDEKDVTDDSITCKMNDKRYTADGVVSNVLNKFVDKFFTNMRTNFTHEGDIHDMKPLLKNKACSKYEYDLNKAYPNVAMTWSDATEKIPIFGCFDIWEKFSSDKIDGYCYYSISDKRLTALNPIGIVDNILDGYMIQLLLSRKCIKRKDIEYCKRPSQFKPWRDYKSRFKELYKELTKDCGDDYKQKMKCKNDMRIYIGVLGDVKSKKSKQFTNLSEEDIDLMNYNKSFEKWVHTMVVVDEDDETNEKHVYSTQSKKYKNINASTIRNYIISFTNRLMIQTMMNIHDKTGKYPKNITTDAIGYDFEAFIPAKHVKKFKLCLHTHVKYDNIQKLKVKLDYRDHPTHKVNSVYHDIKVIRQNILDSLSDKFKNSTILGAPGTGKTYSSKQRPVKYTMCGTTTNLCKRNMDKDAETLYSMLLQHPTTKDRHFKIFQKLRYQRVWLDEFSMTQQEYWDLFFIGCLKYGTRMYITGDINQIGPIGHGKLNMDNPIVKIFMGDVVTLTKDYRNDKDIIKLRDQVLAADHNFNLKSELSTDNWRQYDRHISVTNIHRRYVNSEILSKKGYVYKWSDDLDELEASKGVLLVCRTKNEDHGLHKGEFYTVVDNGELFELSNINYKHVVKVNTSVMKCFDVGYCCTYHSTQGLTLRNNFCLHQVSKAMDWDPSILYTGITRGCKRQDVHLYNESHRCDGCVKCLYKLPVIEEN